jgi:hypothetical protein
MSKHIPVNQLKSIRKHRYILKRLSTVSAPKRKKMLQNAPAQLFSVLKTLCKLASDGRLSLGKAKRHRGLAAKIGKSKASDIKRLAQQEGGAIGSILAGVLPFLSPLISKIFK